jgi:hypothetical protein
MKSLDSIRIVILSLIFILGYSNIQSQSAYLTKINDLQFGDVFMGYSKEVLDTDIDAAKFQFYHTRWFRRDVRIQFTLPTSLRNGLDQIPIIFNNTHATWSYNDQLSGRTNFDPISGITISRVWFYRPVYIWLGGSITTSLGLTPGIYTGDIIITITY